MPIKLTASIVVYCERKDRLAKVINSFFAAASDSMLYIVDNSPDNALKAICDEDRIIYINTGNNMGFGSGHNVALRHVLNNSQYHLILNPDIYFDSNVISELLCFMNTNSDVALTMPKVLYPDGSLQYLCKLLPTPSDLFLRRFCFVDSLRQKLSANYELRASGYADIMDVPYLSGCFMLLRTSALLKVGLFDERFFMYLEDTDLSRRIHQEYRTVYYPRVTIYHEHGKGSYRNIKLLFIHIASAFKYFNKWGWFFDKQRKQVNSKILFETMGK